VFPYCVRVGNRRDQGTHLEYGLVIETLGRPLWVGQCRDLNEVDRLVEVVQRSLRERCPTWVETPDCPDRQILDASGTLPGPPSDSALSCRREWDRTEFLGHTSVDWSDGLLHLVVGTLIVILLSLIVIGISTSVHWPLVLAFAGSVGLPELIYWWGWVLRCRRWVVRPGEISTSIPGLGPVWSRTTDIEWLDRIELRRLPADPYRYARRAPGFELVLCGLDGEARAVFGPLTEGEARWMAGIVADVLKDALPRTGQEVYRWSVTVDPPAAGSRAMADVWLDEVLADPGSKGSTAGKKR
jgi:hypothetical protein